MDKPKPIYLVRDEGGDLEPFVSCDATTPNMAHAVYFADGSVFDLYNGWRGKLHRKPIVRVPMGSA